MSYVVMAFYKFTALDASESMREALLLQMKKHQIKGTIIIASEGINGSFCGEENAVDALITDLKARLNLDEIQFKRNDCEFNPFDKAKVKLRPEIVTLGVDNVNPEGVTGERVPPEGWNQLISDPEVLVIDTRNNYEVQLGSFKNAINPETENFRDFPEFVDQHLSKAKHKKIAMFCTGGIRCEKSTAYLKQRGFESVYQLEGGILSYLDTVEVNDSLWEGSCFVFDNRVAVDPMLNPVPVGSIDKEWKNKNRKKSINCGGNEVEAVG